MNFGGKNFGLGPNQSSLLYYLCDYEQVFLLLTLSAFSCKIKITMYNTEPQNICKD